MQSYKITKTYNYIYKITNTINGKIYIGLHITDDLNDNYLGSGIAIKNSIKKYGKENFNKEYLAFTDNKDALDNLEKYYIKKYGANLPEVGYNLTEGGEGGRTSGTWSKGHKFSKLRNQKISKALKGNKNCFTPTIQWLTPDGEVKSMCIALQKHWHPDWVPYKPEN